MTTLHTNKDFYNQLETNLPTSTTEIRQKWASVIIENDVNIKALSKLLYTDKKIASRFLWLLSEVGLLNPNKLNVELSFLFRLSDEFTHIDMKKSFPTFWSIAGVPVSNEVEAIDLLFNWIQSSSVDITTKSRSLIVLYELTEKHPELKNELKLCLENEILINTNSFTLRAEKIVAKL